jgi:hypothetical protein
MGFLGVSLLPAISRTVTESPCIGSDKEQYDPTIVRLLSHHQTRAAVRDIWVIDFPNHGETAILNRQTLDARKAAGKGMCSAFALLQVYTVVLIF